MENRVNVRMARNRITEDYYPILEISRTSDAASVKSSYMYSTGVLHRSGNWTVLRVESLGPGVHWGELNCLTR